MCTRALSPGSSSSATASRTRACRKSYRCPVTTSTPASIASRRAVSSSTVARPVISASTSWSTRPAARGEHAHDLLRVGAEGLVAGEEQLAQRSGKGALAGRVEPEQLFDEERDALAALEERSRLLGAGSGRGARAPAPDLAGGEPQHDAAGAAVPLQFGEETPQRVAPADVVGAVAEDERSRPR